MGNPLASQQLLLRVEEMLHDDLMRMENVFQEELKSWHPYVSDVLTHLMRYRGKRLRPVLLMLTGHALGSVREEHHVLAAVVEMIHTATLVHDDVLDDASSRRHVATVNARWNNETSVLLGDYLFTHAFHLTSSLGDAHYCRLIGQATNLVCEGELCQIHERGNQELSEESYFRIIESKTAELCALSCDLGARCVTSDEKIIKHVREFGRSLGIAFQIADDLLDILGSEQQTGKTLGSDLVKQKPTLPLIHLLQEIPETFRPAIDEVWQNPSERSRRRLISAFEEYGALDYARTRAEEFVSQAKTHLQILPESPARQLLEEMADFVILRTY